VLKGFFAMEKISLTKPNVIELGLDLEEGA